VKQSPRSCKTPAKVSESALWRLNSYALAAGAAGIGILALAQPSEAKIVYMPAHLVITSYPGGIYNLDLNHDGKIDFTFIDTLHCTVDFCGGKLFVSGRSVNSAEGKTTLASALTAGALIGSKRPFNGFLMASTPGAGPYFGYWVNVADRYLGLKFKIEGEVHYGWARLSVNLNTQLGPVSGLMTGYAYETIPNKGIIAGQTKGTDDSSVEQLNPASLTQPMLEGATLGLLALGAPARAGRLSHVTKRRVYEAQ